MSSIRRWLLGWLIFGFLAASGIAGYGIFRTVHEEANELFDYELHAVALSVPPTVASTDALAHAPVQSREIFDERIAIEVLDEKGRGIYRSPDAPGIDQLIEGFRTIERGEK